MGVMGEAQHRRSVVTLLALALAVATGSLPAAAQSGSEAVVCVGSERRTLATNPIRRVYTEDMEIVYRIGADIGQRDQVERDLSSDLGSYPEVWCAWSDPGDDHAVIISYTGVIRQDLTVDPDDPRFQAFSVGFGTDFDAAETQATTINQRFSSQSDGSGYEVLLRETWSVAEDVAEVGAPEPNRSEGPICTGRASSEGCWMEISNHAGCYLWNPFPQDDETVSWSGDCSGGFAYGQGETTWYENGVVSETDVGPRGGGKPEGFWVIRDPDGSRSEGPYVNGERHGAWTYYDENGNELGEIRYENGRPIGGPEGVVGPDEFSDGHLGEMIAIAPNSCPRQPTGGYAESCRELWSKRPASVLGHGWQPPAVVRLGHEDCYPFLLLFLGIGVPGQPVATTQADADPHSVLVPGHLFRDCPACPEIVVVPEGIFVIEIGGIGGGATPVPGRPRRCNRQLGDRRRGSRALAGIPRKSQKGLGSSNPRVHVRATHLDRHRAPDYGA